MAHDRPVAVLEIADRVGERGKRNGVGAEIHLAVAIADRERWALARADEEIVLAGEQKGEREGAAQARQRRLDRVDRRAALIHLHGNQVGHDLGVGLGAELCALAFQLLTQLAKVLDDAVVNHRHPVGGVGVGIGLVRPPMGGPAGVADAGGTLERLALQPGLQVPELAFGALARQRACFQRRHAGRVIAAVLEPFERVDELTGHRLGPQNPDDPAHGCSR